MEGIYRACTQRPAVKGFSLVEIMVVLAIVGLIGVATVSSLATSMQLNELNKAKAYLLTTQALQSRNWFETGEYLALSALPQSELPSITISQTIDDAGMYEIVATLTSRPSTDSCRVIKISEYALTPTECW